MGLNIYDIEGTDLPYGSDGDEGQVTCDCCGTGDRLAQVAGGSYWTHGNFAEIVATLTAAGWYVSETSNECYCPTCAYEGWAKREADCAAKDERIAELEAALDAALDALAEISATTTATLRGKEQA